MGSAGYKRIVVKIGTSVIATDSGGLDARRMESLVTQITNLVNQGSEVILVSSGAIAAGVEKLALRERPKEIPKLQAAAAVGQGLLVEKYASLFSKYNLQVGQVLLTQFDTTHRQQYLNARNTLNQLLKMGVIPIVNENDTTAVDEIRFGDNDTLAALVSVLIEADLLVILSDISGFYTADPRSSKKVVLLQEIEDITPQIEEMAQGIGSKFSSGGMVTKLNAARIVTAAQIGLVIVDGREPQILQKVVRGNKIGTHFKPKDKKISSRKLWIGFARIPCGTIYVDDGAAKALVKGGKSLLPAGVARVEGDFQAGDAVDIANAAEKIFARGLTNYSAKELQKIRGKKSSQITAVEMGEAAEEVVHRDCLVIF